MADEKKADGRTVALFNKSQRAFDHGLEVGADGKKSPRRHMPNTSHLYTAEEAAKLSGYKELIDLSKLPGQIDARKLKEDNAKLSDENARLKASLAALQEPKEPKDPKKGK